MHQTYIESANAFSDSISILICIVPMGALNTWSVVEKNKILLSWVISMLQWVYL